MAGQRQRYRRHPFVVMAIRPFTVLAAVVAGFLMPTLALVAILGIARTGVVAIAGIAALAITVAAVGVSVRRLRSRRDSA